ncbi:DUF1553 domain-containing protein [bacterium]|nr:MAG: DUF1553 domain-containing protein [bacterium]
MFATTRVKWLGFAFAALPYPFIAAGAGQLAPQPKASFTHDVQPIFKAHCLSCHAGNSAQGGLRLDTPEGVLKAVVKGDPEKSELLRRIQGHGGLPRMPMGFAPLSNAQITAVKNWIAQGARIDSATRKHWAYVAPVLPKVPAVRLKTWVRNPIDSFVLARLEKEGLKPSPEASRETLIRRLSLDIIGLPPTPSETDAFLRDKSPNAYEKVVDRLLASPHYGEKMAQKWLDLARYADSDGFEKDLTRTAYKYRDWTIDAFNRNKPFDQFTIEQIAGDQLPNATIDNLIATGFCRNAMTNREDGVDQAEAYLNVEVDRVSTVATTFMGSTLACARCHDHKYDPFSQKDFYRMTAFFSNDLYTPKGNPVYSNVKWEEPEIKVPNKEQAAKLAILEKAIAALPKPTVDTLVPPEWTGANPTNVEAEKAKLDVDPIGTIIATGVNAPTELYKVSLDAPNESLTGLRLETIAGRNPGNLNFVITNIRVLADGKEVPLLGSSADFSQSDFDASKALHGDADNGWAVSPKGTDYHALVASFAQPVKAQKLQVWIAMRSKYVGHNLGAFRLSVTRSPEPHAEHGKSIAAVRRDALVAQKMELERTLPSALILRERDPKATPQEWLRTRGEFLSKAELLTAGTPTFLPAIPQGVRPSRLALAKWLVAKDNPLTARVQANRLWEGLFGTGLVETSEDFGTQGTPPSHPELLDWLAVRLRDGGWNVKDTIRLIVCSAAYRQSSVATPALLRKDPNNRLLARGSRFRLEAETIRDNALTVAGLLSRRVGGPSVMPDQPDGVWDIPYGGERWMRADGENRWRRGLYTTWKRSAPYPAFVAFDATSREACTVRRIRTNTPLQALALLNDTGMIAAAEALAGRMAKEGGKDPLRYGFRLATGRQPNAKELLRLQTLKNGLLTRYRRSPIEAAKLGGPEKAAMTLTANVLLNLDETITRE